MYHISSLFPYILAELLGGRARVAAAAAAVGAVPGPGPPLPEEAGQAHGLHRRRRQTQAEQGRGQEAAGRKTNLNIAEVFIESSAAQYEDEVAAARTTYSALNCQLVAELPQLIQLAGGVLGQAVHQLAVARKLYVGNCTRELLAVMEVSYSASVQAISGVLVSVLQSVVCKVSLSLTNLIDHKSCY